MEDDADDYSPPARMSREDLIEAIGEFMTGTLRVEDLFRSHLCDTMVHRIYEEFGTEGMADLMVKIESRADWIMDMVYESSELHDAMFKRHGTFDDDIVFKARSTMALEEMNTKMNRLRKKYANMIVDEIWESENFEP